MDISTYHVKELKDQLDAAERDAQALVAGLAENEAVGAPRPVRGAWRNAWIIWPPRIACIWAR